MDILEQIKEYHEEVSVPIRGLFNLTRTQSIINTLESVEKEFPSPSGDYLI